MRFVLCITVLAFAMFFQVKAQEPYPFPTGVKASSMYEVWVNGQPHFVYDSPVPASFCSFDISGPVEVVIRTRDDLKWVDARPATANVSAVWHGNEIRFKLQKPTQLSIELNGKLGHPLFLFANAPEQNKPRPGDKGVYYFEAGKVHYPGKIELKDNESVYVEGGAVVVGVVHANNASNIKVYGQGILDGTYNNRLNPQVVKQAVINPGVLDTMQGTYHRFLQFTDCNDVTIEGVTLLNSTSWQVVPIHCNKVNINNIKILAEQASDDGIDIVRSENVTIRNSFIRTKDDCIAIKAHMNYPANACVRNVLVENCVIWNSIWGNALEIGFELEADYVEDITFRNCDIIHVEYGAVFSIHNASNSHVRRILLENIRVEDARHKLFDFAIFRSKYSKGDGTEDPKIADSLYLHGIWDNVMKIAPEDSALHAAYRGKISDITIRKMTVQGIEPFSVFCGYNKEHGVRNVTIENLSMNGMRIRTVEEGRMRLEHATNIIVK